jgi:putative MFS transporter
MTATHGAPDALTALDEAQLTRRHLVFLAALLGALIFDYLKPFTISFVIPGMREMWDLSEAEASYLPVAGLSGTAVGALFWGAVADRIGRRTTLLWTVGIFTVGSLCGLMGEYWQSVIACLVMGFGVGGETPIVFALAAEYVPARLRGRSLLFLGIVGSTAGYALAAVVATVSNAIADPSVAWRLMWLFGLLPAGLILLLRSRVVPESARYLLSKGRAEDAAAAASSLLGHKVSVASVDERGERGRPPRVRLYGLTIALAFFSFAWGVANFGFITWMPTLLQQLGYSDARSSASLAGSALTALPALVVTGILLTRWSTGGTLIGYAGGGATTLVGVGIAAGGASPNAVALVVSIAFGLFFVTSIGAVFSFYAAEVFPTTVRASRSGLVAATGKVGGVIGPLFGGFWLARGGSPLGLQAPLALTLVAAAAVLAFAGVETGGRSLEAIELRQRDGRR